MATSSTSTFDLQVGQIISAALTDVGAIGPGMATPPELGAHARIRLNVLVKSLAAKGAALWKIVRRVYVTTGAAFFTPAADVLDLEEPANYIKSGSTSRATVTSMPRDEFMSLGDRTLTGDPARYYVEKALSGLTVYFNTVPPSGDSFEYAAVIKHLDNATDANTQDFPQKWMRALEYGLALELCLTYNVEADKVQMIRSIYEQELSEVLNDDNERGGIQFVPWGGSYYYGGEK